MDDQTRVLSAITALVAAVTALVSAVAALLWSLRQQREIDSNKRRVRALDDEIHPWPKPTDPDRK